jgi:hypothetical protein
MSKDINCPYCGKELDIDHDDGRGYEEDVTHQQQCTHCDKHFVFTTSIVFMYYPEKADCLNGKKHKWEPTATYPKKHTQVLCQTCGEWRQPTPKERVRFNLDE